MELIPLDPRDTDDGALFDRIDATKSRPTRWVVVGAIAVLLVAGIAVVLGRGSNSSPAAAPKGKIITGTVQLRSTKVNFYTGSTLPGSWCSGSGGFSDLQEGAQVLILNEGGATIGSGSLGKGAMDSIVECTWTFSVPNIPDAKFYQVKVSHRDGPTYSLADMEQRGWKVSLVL